LTQLRDLSLHEIYFSKFEVEGRAESKVKESTEGIFLNKRTKEALAGSSSQLYQA
jgi:hypothetical protein